MLKDNQNYSKISGLVERVTYHNAENGFCVIKVKVSGKKDLFTVIGNTPSILAGEHIEAIGIFETNKQHGLQFKASLIKTTPPTSLEGIEKYLASGLIKGIGPVYAKKLIDAFGCDVLRVIEEESYALRTIPGIGNSRADTIIQSWQTQKVIREIMIFLHSHNISTNRAIKIYREYGVDSINILKDNPYKLASDIKGIGFKSADTIAETLNIAKDSTIRIRAGINYALTQSFDNGNCGLPTHKLLKTCSELLETSEELVINALNLEIEDKNVILDIIDEEECVFLKGLAHSEKLIAEGLIRMSKSQLSWPQINSEVAIKWITETCGISLSPSQREAIRWALWSGFAVITGGPGVGKTTLVNSLIKIFKSVNVNILLAAPTGRAAKRLSEATNCPAVTIHRLLKRNPDQDKYQNVTLKCQLLIIDEASMIDVPLMYGVLRAMPEKSALFLVGDIDQLPSVGPGQVLSDIINSEGLSVFALTEIFRQGTESNIITNAHRINKGLMPILKAQDNQANDFFFIEVNDPQEIVNEIVSLVNTRLPQKYNISSLNDIQVLSPMNKGILGTRNLNIELQKALTLIPEETNNQIQVFGNSFRCNDKVMQIINNYDKDVFNGDIGIIVEINKQEEELTISFDGKKVIYEFSELDEIVLAYTISIHKSQGSEYHTVIIPLTMQHHPMLQRKLLYTAITRAKKLAIIIGQKQALLYAVNNNSAAKRFTTLKKRLVELTQWF